MTCREALRKKYADMPEDAFNAVLESACPDDFWDLEAPGYCEPYSPACQKCWNREMSEEIKKGEPMPEEKPVMMPVYVDGKIVPDLTAMTDIICNARRKLIDNGFNKEETFWVIKTLLEGIVK